VHGKVKSIFFPLRRNYVDVNTEISRKECAEKCLEIVVRLNMNRLFKRIGSRHFEKPKHLALYAKGPITPQWNKLMLKPVQRKLDAIKLAEEAEDFNKAFEQLDEAETEGDKVAGLIDLVKRSFTFTIDGRSLQHRLEKAGYGKKTWATRPFREINKTAAYWRICCNLASLSRSYSRYFQNLMLIPIEHYTPSTRPGKEEERFTHAEVQIITYYEATNPPLWPRALGTSKKACFLCYEFIRCHGYLHVSRSHGIVFSRWAVPDRDDFSPESLKRLRGALEGVDGRVREECEKAGMGRVKQDDPVQSSIDLSYFSLPNGSAASLASIPQEQVGQAVGSHLSGPDSWRVRDPISFSERLKRIFKILTNFGAQNDSRPEFYEDKAKGKEKVP
jgi:hypothetical protein